MMNIHPRDFPDNLANQFKNINTNYQSTTKDEAEEYILDTIRQMHLPMARRNREENLLAWEKGWGENYEAFRADGSERSLKPKYFRPSKFFRFEKKIIRPENPNIEYDLLRIVRHLFFIQYFQDFDNIYEIGCGSCQNIFALGKLFPEKNIIGMDWTKASVKIAQLIHERCFKNVSGIRFDMLNPSESVEFEPNSVVFTLHAMEQIGENFEKLLSFLIRKKPSLVFHFESIVELFEKDNLYDYLATMYCNRRDYLNGYLNALKERAKNNEIRIIDIHRPMIGGIHHDASAVVWQCAD